MNSLWDKFKAWLESKNRDTIEVWDVSMFISMFARGRVNMALLEARTILERVEGIGRGRV